MVVKSAVIRSIIRSVIVWRIGMRIVGITATEAIFYLCKKKKKSKNKTKQCMLFV